MKLDTTTLIGLLVGCGCLLGGFILEGGSIGALIGLSPALIVFGGTFGSILVSFSIKEMMQLPRYFRLGFMASPNDPVALIHRLCEYNDKARREKALALEPDAKKEMKQDEFIGKGLQLIVDGAKWEEIQGLLETMMYTEESSITMGASVFESCGGYAPTMGIVGTVMGLVHVLGSITGSATGLAEAIGSAFTATMYGVASANLLWLPMANNLHVKLQQQTLSRSIGMAGLEAIANGKMSTRNLQERLMEFIEATGKSDGSEPEEGAQQRRAR